MEFSSVNFLPVSSVQTIPRTAAGMSSRHRQIISSQHYLCSEKHRNSTVTTSYKQKAAVIKAKSMPIEKIDGLDPFLGIMLSDGTTFQQRFSVKSYEVGADMKVSVPALMNYVQEIGINHLQGMGLYASGLGCTPEMCRSNLIWAIWATEISIHSYPSWCDVIDIKTWIYGSSRGMYRECLLYSSKTGETIANVVTSFVFMNKETRKLASITDGIFCELNPHTTRASARRLNRKKLQRLDVERADHIRTSLIPLWNDLDANGHVTNIKYINWILEGVPYSILKGYVLDRMWLEYRRECGKDSELQSLSTRVGEEDIDRDSRDGEIIGFYHSLLLWDGVEIARARTHWRPKTSRHS